jgi:hypothetical protein
MSVTLATVAEALIEFILSLLRDPDAADEFEKDPEAALASRGLGGVGVSDVHAVAPVIIDRAQVVPIPAQSSHQQDASSVHVTIAQEQTPVVREIQGITQNFSWIDDRDSVVDQSTNQNIWAEGDVTQTFDQEAVVASGDDAVAAGEDVDIEQTVDHSLNVTAGGDANIGSDTIVTVVEDSYNEQTDNSVNTDNSSTTTVVSSLNDGVQISSSDGSGNSSSSSIDATGVTISQTRAAPAEEAPAAPAAPAAEAPAPAYQEAPAEEPESDAMFGQEDAALADEDPDADF